MFKFNLSLSLRLSFCNFLCFCLHFLCFSDFCSTHFRQENGWCERTIRCKEGSGGGCGGERLLQQEDPGRPVRCTEVGRDQQWLLSKALRKGGIVLYWYVGSDTIETVFFLLKFPNSNSEAFLCTKKYSVSFYPNISGLLRLSHLPWSLQPWQDLFCGWAEEAPSVRYPQGHRPLQRLMDRLTGICKRYRF